MSSEDERSHFGSRVEINVEVVEVYKDSVHVANPVFSKLIPKGILMNSKEVDSWKKGDKIMVILPIPYAEANGLL